jgi:hypothetical protein
LWPRQSGFQGAKIPNAKGTAELRDQRRGRRSPRLRLGKRSLSQTAEQFRVLIDELFNGPEKR